MDGVEAIRNAWGAVVMRVILVVGARPNFMKVAPIVQAMRSRSSEFEPFLVHTGQHYDERMAQIFFEQLGMPKPDVYLGVGSASHAVQTANVMTGFETVVRDHTPDWVVVVGDVNSTMACALTSVKMLVRTAHVEAGLRSNDRTMPEEINRIVTDHVCDLLLTPSPDADENLRAEGIPEFRIARVGNVMIDSLRATEPLADRSTVLDQLGIEAGRYGLITLHRPSNVDDPATFAVILDALEKIQLDVTLVFPVHPRTRRMLDESGLAQRIAKMKRLLLMEPAGYLDFIKLQKNALLVLTDSGGVQEETTALGVPCLTMRETTERPITATEGTNIVVGTDGARIVAEAQRILAGHSKRGRIPALWDGRTSDRILDRLLAFRAGDTAEEAVAAGTT